MLLLLLMSSPAQAESATSWGGMGLIEMRDARFRPDGALEAGASIRRQRRNYTINFQALRWLETTFRFTERLNATTGSGTTTDRSFDVKIRVLEESDWLPAVATSVVPMKRATGAISSNVASIAEFASRASCTGID